jgi:hypothetical protein
MSDQRCDLCQDKPRCRDPEKTCGGPFKAGNGCEACDGGPCYWPCPYVSHGVLNARAPRGL